MRLVMRERMRSEGYVIGSAFGGPRIPRSASHLVSCAHCELMKKEGCYMYRNVRQTFLL